MARIPLIWWLAVVVPRVLLAADPELMLAAPGVVPTILTPAPLAPEAEAAVQDLQRCLGLMLGAQVPRVAEPAVAPAPVVAVGYGQFAARWVKPEPLAGLGPEGALVRTTPEGVCLLGQTPGGASHAVYLFLDRLGCRWFFPGAAWEEVPRRERLTIAPLDLTSQPSFALRSIWYGWGLCSAGTRNDNRDWQRRNRQGGWLTGHAGHAYAGIADPKEHFAAHPEWFPLIGGKRVGSGQLCLANPELQQRAIAYAREAFRRQPNARMVSLSPNDGGGYCECEACRALGSVSDQTLTLANVVAAAIHEEFPDRYVAMYAYYANCAPPTIKGHPNVLIFVATAFIRGGYTVKQLLDGWSAQVSHLAIRDYYNVIIWNRDQPRTQLAHLREQLPYYYEHKVIGISAESSNSWGAEGLNYYVAGRLMVDARTNVDAVLEDFYAGCWHAAAPAMRRYYGRWTTQSRVTPAQLRLAFEDLQDAARLAAADAVVSRRVDLMRLYLHWVFLYQRHQQATGDQVQPTARVAMHFAWRLLDTNLLHSYAQFRERRMWRIGKDFPKYELERWKTSDAPPETVVLDTSAGVADSRLEAPGDDAGVALDEPPPPVAPKPKPFFTHDEIEQLCEADLAALPVPETK